MAATKKQTPASKPIPWKILLLLFAVAFAIRLIHVIQLQSMPTFDDPTMDEGYHIELVKQINSAEGYPDEPYFRAPLYPYLLALLFKITGGSFFGVRVIQIFLGSFLPVLINLLGRKLFTDKIALWSAAIAAVYPTFIYYDASLLITLLEVLLSTSMVLLLAHYDGRSYWPLILGGIALGLAGIARPTLLLFGPALLLWAWYVLKPKLGMKQAINAIVIVGVCSLLIVLPVTIRNYVVAHEFIVVSWQGGFNFYVGNNRNADGWSARVEGLDPSWRGGYLQSIAIAEQAAGRKLKYTEISDYWADRAFQEIAEEPGRFVALLIKKVRLLVNGYEIPNNQDEYLSGEFSSIQSLSMLRGPIYFPYGLLAPLAIIGGIIALRKWRQYLLLYLFFGAFSLSLMLFFVCSRFRQPLIPFMILFAVLGVFALIDFFRQAKHRRVVLYGLILIALVIESNHDLLKLNAATIAAENKDLLGNAWLRKGNLELALSEYQKAVAADPTYGKGHNNIGTVLVRQSRYTEAMPHLRRAIDLDPRLPEPYVNLSICCSETGDHASAITTLEQARSLFPTNPHVFFFLGLAYIDVGRMDDAMAALRESLKLDPANGEASRILRELQDRFSPKP